MDDNSQYGMPPWDVRGQQPGASDWPPPDQDADAGDAPYYPYPPAGAGPSSPYGFPPPYPNAPEYGAPYPPRGYPEQPGRAGPPSQGWSPPGYPAQPGYGWPAAPSMPYGYPPAAPPPAPRKRLGAPAIIGLVALVLIVCTAATIGVLVALAPSRGSVFSTVSNRQTPGVSTVQPTATTYGYDFKDTLDGTSNAGWALDQHCFFKDGTYHANPGSQYGSIFCGSPAGSFTDFDMHATASQVAGPLDYGYGLGFRHAALGNYYVFDVTSNGEAWFDKLVSGTWSRVGGPWQVSTLARGLNAHTTVRVVGHGSSFTFYVNGTQVGQASDSTFPSGKVGVFSGQSGLDAAFSNFEVQGNP